LWTIQKPPSTIAAFPLEIGSHALMQKRALVDVSNAPKLTTVPASPLRLGDANSSTFAISVLVESLPDGPVRDFAIAAIRSPSQNQKARLEKRNRMVYALAVSEYPGKVRQQSRELSKDLKRARRTRGNSPLFAKLHEILQLNDGSLRGLSTGSIRRMIGDLAGSKKLEQ
jgi:hypothetical protein